MSFLGSLGKGIVGGVVGFATGGPGGAVVGAATALAGKGRPARPGISTRYQQPRMLQQQGPTIGNTTNRPPGGAVRCPPGTTCNGVAFPGTNYCIGNCLPTAFAEPGYPPPPTQQPMQQASSSCACASKNGGARSCTCCLPGGGTGHTNKTDYFLKDGTFVPKGSKCVSRRRLNPANGQAALRAIRRVEATHGLLKRIDKRMQAVARRSTRHTRSKSR